MKKEKIGFIILYIIWAICFAISIHKMNYQVYRANIYKHLYDTTRSELIEHEIIVLPMAPDDTEILKMWRRR